MPSVWFLRPIILNDSPDLGVQYLSIRTIWDRMLHLFNISSVQGTIRIFLIVPVLLILIDDMFVIDGSSVPNRKKKSKNLSPVHTEETVKD